MQFFKQETTIPCCGGDGKMLVLISWPSNVPTFEIFYLHGCEWRFLYIFKLFVFQEVQNLLLMYLQQTTNSVLPKHIKTKPPFVVLRPYDLSQDSYFLNLFSYFYCFVGAFSDLWNSPQSFTCWSRLAKGSRFPS